MAYSVFDWVKEITERKGNWEDFSEEDKKNFNPWMINKVLSMYEPYIEIVSYVQRYWLVTPQQLYEIYKQYLPQEKIWYKYIKSSKKKENELILNAIAEYYKISTRESKQYLKILPEAEQIQILQALGTDENEINKLYETRSKQNEPINIPSKSGESSPPKKRGRPKKTNA